MYKKFEILKQQMKNIDYEIIEKYSYNNKNNKYDLSNNKSNNKSYNVYNKNMINDIDNNNIYKQ